MNITDAVFDPELGCTAFSVERITYTRTRSGTTSRSSTAQAMGCIHPGTPEMLQLLPEEEREEHSYDDQSDADRAAHKAVPVQVALTLAGSIESIVITVNVQV